MSHWFHRNPLKSSKGAKFELKGAITNSDASKICSELRLRREQFLDLLTTASSSLELVEEQFQSYLRMLHGFVFDVENPEKNSKLIYLGKFTWTNSMLGAEGYQSSDSWFEVLSICMNMAIWYMKRAAWLSAKDDVMDMDAKKIHTALRSAAGIFDYIQTNAEKVGGIPNATGNDFETRIIKTYRLQCLSEAQEITIARAIELKHSPKLICSLAAETARAYETCDKYIDSFEASNFEKWRKYFQLKHKFYLSYAYAYLGEQLLIEDKCGPAIRACKEGLDSYKASEELCSMYAKSSGPGFIAKPESHLFFRRVGPILKRHIEKAERENSFIYHDTVPVECPELLPEAEFGMAKSIEFTYPPRAESWTSSAYRSFDVTKINMPDFTAPKKIGKINLVKEQKVYETDKDPNNLSGCVIS